MIYKWHKYDDRQTKLKETYFFDCKCAPCLTRRQPIVNAYKCTKCKGPVINTNSDLINPKGGYNTAPHFNCLSCKRKTTIDFDHVNKELEAAGRMISLGYNCLVNNMKHNQDQSSDEHTVNTNKLMIATKLLQDGLVKLNQVLHKNNSQLSITFDLLASSNKRLERFDEAVSCAKQYLLITESEFNEDVILFNAQIKLLDCMQLQLNEQLTMLKNKQLDDDQDTQAALKKMKTEVKKLISDAESQLKRLVTDYSDEFGHYQDVFDKIKAMTA